MDKIDKEKCFVFYQRWYEQMKRLPDKEKLLIYESICEYAFNHIITDLAYYLECVMDNIRKTIDDNEEKQNKFLEKQRLNGLRGGRPRLYRNPQEPKKPMGYLEYPTKPNETQKSHNKNKEQEQEQEQRIKTKNKNKEQEQEEKNIIESAKAASTSSQDDDTANAATIKTNRSDKEKELLGLYKEVANYFNKAMDGKQIQKIKKLNDFRKAHIAARLKDFTKQDLFIVIDKAAASDFLNGCGRNGFKATFDWIFRPNNFPKILEGNYDNGNHNQQQTHGIYTRLDENAERAKRDKEWAEYMANKLTQPDTTTDDIPEALRNS